MLRFLRQNRRNPRQGIETILEIITSSQFPTLVRIDEIPVRGLKPKATALAPMISARVRIDEIPVRGLKRSVAGVASTIAWALVRIDEIPVRGLKLVLLREEKFCLKHVRIDEIPVRGLKQKEKH